MDSLKRGPLGWLAAFAVTAAVLPAMSAEITGSLSDVKPKPFGGSLLVQTAGTVNEADNRSTSGLYLLGANYSMPQPKGSIVVAASLGYQTQYSYQGEGTQTLLADKMPEGKSGDWIDPRISIVQTIPELWNLDSISFGLKGTIAGLSYASEQKTQVFSVGPTFSYSKYLGTYWSRLNKLTFTQRFDYRYIHHNYMTRNDGKVNTPQFMAVENLFEHALGTRSSLTFNIGYSYGITYQSSGHGDIDVGLDFSYNLTDYWSMSLGVGNDTSGYAADGQSKELNFLNPESASAYLNLAIKI